MSARFNQPNVNKELGQATLSFLTALPALSLVIGVCVVSSLISTAHTFLTAEVYYLSRAHLYGNHNGDCQLSSHWEKSWVENSSIECPTDYFHSASVSLGKFWGYPLRFHTELSTKASL